MKNKASYPVKRIFLMDEVAIVISMAIALLVRFGEKVFLWNLMLGGIYLTVTITFCLFHVIIFLIYDNRRESIFIQDPLDNMVTVVVSRCILMLLSLIYLYVMQKTVDVSRAIMGMFFVISVALGFLFRMLYRGSYLKKYGIPGDNKTLILKAPYPGAGDMAKMVKDGGYDDVLVVTAGAETADVEAVLAGAEELGIRTYCSMDSVGYSVRPGIVSDVDGYSAIPAFVRKEKFLLFGVQYSIARTEEAVLHVMRHIKELSGKYVCFSNVHTSVMARESKEYADVLNGAAFVFPDGTPIAQLQRRRGIVGADKVPGPDFMEHMFRDTQDGSLSHYFYGSSQETLDALKENLEKKYPGIVIKGLYSPPFRELSAQEDEADVAMINAAGADIVWVGLGAPKQERWMNAHEGRINGVMMGVGAGFDFHAGTIKRAPLWIRKIGMEWLYRLFQDPKRLISRYLVTNTKYLWYLFVDTLSGGRR